MRIILPLICVMVLASEPLFGQKLIQRSWDAAALSRIELRTDMAYTIRVTTDQVSNISLRARAEGETFEHVLINEQIDKNLLTLKTSYTPYFEPINDKLAAHKVMGLDMELVIPEGMQVQIESALASVKAQGAYRNLNVKLEDGNCTLTQFIGNARLTTRGGLIEVRAFKGVAAQANSRDGRVFNQLPDAGNYQIYARSVTGDIKLMPSQ